MINCCIRQLYSTLSDIPYFATFLRRVTCRNHSSHSQARLASRDRARVLAAFEAIIASAVSTSHWLLRINVQCLAKDPQTASEE